MDFAEVVARRYSCRSFLDRQVPKSQVEKLVALAQRVPNWGNTQPWKIYAAGGQTARDIRADLKAAFLSGDGGQPDFEMPESFADPLMTRYRDLGRALFQVLDIGRGDKDKRAAHYANNFAAFGASALVFVTVPKGQTGYVVYDAGALVAGLCLAAASLDLDTIVLAALARYPEVVRRHVPMTEDEALVIGVALGYADPQAPANRFRSERAPLAETLTCLGLE